MARSVLETITLFEDQEMCLCLLVIWLSDLARSVGLIESDMSFNKLFLRSQPESVRLSARGVDSALSSASMPDATLKIYQVC